MATSASSAGVLGLPVTVRNRSQPEATVDWPLESAVPTVRCCEPCMGGLQEGDASGGPCVLLGPVHCW